MYSKKKEELLVGILYILIIFAFYIVATIGVVWLLCWSFGIPFAWSYVIGAWALGLMFKLIR